MGILKKTEKFLMKSPLSPFGLLRRASGRQERKEAHRIQDDQRDAFNKQQDTVNRERDRINAQLDSSKQKVNKGMARASRSRIRGGIFGEQNPTGQLSDRLG